MPRLYGEFLYLLMSKVCQVFFSLWVHLTSLAFTPDNRNCYPDPFAEWSRDGELRAERCNKRTIVHPENKHYGGLERSDRN
jgi:hypothetical protein